MQGAILSWGGTLAGSASFDTGALMTGEQIEERHGRRIRQAARSFFESVRRQRHLRPSFINLMTFCIQQASWRRTDPETVDYRYWEEHGWFRRGRTWFVPHRTNPFTVALARATGSVLRRLFAGA
jgi:hypothetical protein